jgi:hypothetical protein
MPYKKSKKNSTSSKKSNTGGRRRKHTVKKARRVRNVMRGGAPTDPAPKLTLLELFDLLEKDSDALAEFKTFISKDWKSINYTKQYPDYNNEAYVKRTKDIYDDTNYENNPSLYDMAVDKSETPRVYVVKSMANLFEKSSQVFKIFSDYIATNPPYSNYDVLEILSKMGDPGTGLPHTRTELLQTVQQQAHLEEHCFEEKKWGKYGNKQVFDYKQTQSLLNAHPGLNKIFTEEFKELLKQETKSTVKDLTKKFETLK